MRIRGSGTSSPGTPSSPPSAPETPVQNTLADAANATIVFSLPGADRVQNALTQCSVKCATNVLPLGAVGDVFAGPVYGELWLVRDAGGFAMQLDSGFVQGGAQRTTIGVVGSIMYNPGDELAIFLWNDSGAAFVYKIEFATDCYDPDLVAATGAYTKLSKKHSATWTYGITILNNGANAGNHTASYIFADGLMGTLVFLSVLNADVAARACTFSYREAPGTIVFAILAYDGALAGGGQLNWPVGVAFPGIGINLRTPPSTSIFTVIEAIAVSQDSRHVSLFEIETRPPTVTIAAPVGATQTVVPGLNEVR